MVVQRFRLPNPVAWLAMILVLILFAATLPAHADGPVVPELAPAAGPDTMTTGVATRDPSSVDESLSSIRDLHNLGLGMSNQLNENAWDFTDPDSIPGFASQPYHLRSNSGNVD